MRDTDSNSGNKTKSGVKINIRCSNNVKFSVKIGLESTVAEFKSKIAQNCDVATNQQRLIYNGRILKDDQTLDSYGLQEEHTVHMVRGFVPDASSANSMSVDSPASEGPNTVPEIARGVSSDGSQGYGGGLLDSLFPSLDGSALAGGATGLLGAGLGFEQMEQQLSRNPNMINEMLSMPFMQNMLNNPDIIRNMMRSDPRMREVLDRNPEIAHALTDPNTLRQTMEAARNPEIMREMMRNTDRAMSNIESHPEGFNMLRRMYENVQEPLNATSMTGSNVGSNPLAALLGSQVARQVEDSTVIPSTVGSDSNSGSSVPNSNPLPNPWRSTSATGGSQVGGASVPGIGGFGALGLFGIDTQSDGLVDPSAMIQELQNPAFTQFMNQMINNPQLSGMFGGDPQSREAMQGLMNQLASPDMQQGMASLSSLFGMQSQQSPLRTGQAGRGAVPPEELYASQLSQLQEMGFFDTRENIQALRATFGNVSAAVERLLQNFGP